MGIIATLCMNTWLARRRRIGRTLLAAALCAAPMPAAFAVDVRLCTTQGAVELELDERNAPQHTRNFVRYAESGFYAGTIIHRSVAGSMLQGGGYDRALARRTPGAPVASEAANGLSNRRGTIAASRSDDADSATAQFFFNLADNTHLDATAESPGYTVFGRVTAGLDVLDAISRQPTRQLGNLDEVPFPLVELESINVIERASLFGSRAEPDAARLQADFAAATTRGNASATLAAADALRRACITLDSGQRLTEAEAAIELGYIDRARFGLEQFMMRATALDPLVPRAQRLYAGLPTARVGNIDARLAQCQKPIAPAIPNGRSSELGTLRIVETAVVRHRQIGETFLNCVARIIDGGDLSEAEAIEATKRYNEIVVELTATAARFNAAVQRFKAMP